MIGKPLGPFATEAEARIAAQAAAEPGLLPVRAAESRRLLARACEAAGVEMGRYDDQVAGWLSVWGPPAAAAVAGWVGRAYEAGLRAQPGGDRR